MEPLFLPAPWSTDVSKICRNANAEPSTDRLWVPLNAELLRSVKNCQVYLGPAWRERGFDRSCDSVARQVCSETTQVRTYRLCRDTQE